MLVGQVGAELAALAQVGGEQQHVAGTALGDLPPGMATVGIGRPVDGDLVRCRRRCSNSDHVPTLLGGHRSALSTEDIIDHLPDEHGLAPDGGVDGVD